MEDLLLYALQIAGESGAKYAEARYHRLESQGMSSRNGVLISAYSEISEGIAIRVLVDGVLGFASTNNLSRDGVREAVQKAIARARTHRNVVKRPIELSEARLGRVKYSVNPLKKFSNIDFEEKIGLHKLFWNSVSNSVREAKVPVATLSYVEWVEEKIVANSDGAYVESSIPRISMDYNIVVYHPQKGYIQRARGLGASGGLEWLEKWNVVGAAADEVRKLEEILLTAVEPPKDSVPVVVGSEIVGLIVHESCGHPSEADRILGREAAQAGKSFIKPNMIGYRIGNENATVVDDPTIPGNYGFYLYDDEGVAARPRYLYKEGLINEFLHNRETAKTFGVESNAAARAMDYTSEPIVRMANTYLRPGDHKFEELLEDVKLGVYIKSYMEWNIDDERWSQRYVGLEAYLIEHGEPTKLVRNPVLELTTKSFYSSIDAVGKELRFYAGTCGKGEPMQGVPVWFGGPDVRLKSVRLGVAVQ
ncbi:MAG: TldD/PmbA family protein [Ignisphaera sp.]